MAKITVRGRPVRKKKPEKPQLTVSGIPYHLEFVGGLRDESGVKLDGRVTLSKCLIEIEPELDPVMQRATLWHELLHVIMFQAGYSDHDEKLINALSYGIITTLHDNPGLSA